MGGWRESCRSRTVSPDLAVAFDAVFIDDAQADVGRREACGESFVAEIFARKGHELRIEIK